MLDESLYLMAPMEIVWGLPLGHIASTAPRIERPLSPRRALEHAVHAALLRPPCGVAFSGGRDSSVVLVVATHVARRDGLAEPVPITKVFPTAPRSEESAWQEAVVHHLGLRDWHRVVIDDELDLVGPLATKRLAEHGLVWPPTIHGDIPMLELLRGGTLIDGEGGDEVFGVGQHRIAPVTRLLRSPRPLRWRRVRSALGALAPARVRAKHASRPQVLQPFTWLRPAALEAMAEAMARVEATKPLSFESSVRMVPRRRTQTLAIRNRRILARWHEVGIRCPLLEPEVVDALARDGGVLGRGDRTTVLRSLVPDLLPDAIMARTTKAEFGGAYMNVHTRSFAADWSGEGVDHGLVDAVELRRLWLCEDRIAPTAALLQAAWLGNQRPPIRSMAGGDVA